MPDLTPEQKAQLDKNIRNMLTQGASESDVITYSNDYRNKYDVGLKKKLSPQEQFGIPLPVFKSGGTNGSSVGSSDGKQKVLDYLQGLKTPEEKELAQPNAANTKQLAYNKGQQKLQEIISTGGHNDPLAVAQKNISESDNMQDKINNYMAQRFVEDKVDGADAKKVLETTDFGKQGTDNLTTTVLRNKADKYEQAVTPLRSIKADYDLSKSSNEHLDNDVTPDLQRAAIEYGARKDPEFAKELQKLGIDLNDSGIDLKNKIGTFKMGQWMDAMMNDPDVNSYLKKENPNLIPAFQRASKQLRVDNKDYGINQVASEVSRAVNKTGFNNIEPIANYYGDEHKKFADQIANQLYKDDPQSLEIWNKYIKDNQEAHMDAPSFLEGVASSGKEFGQGIINTFTEPGKSVSQDVKDKWQKEAENISADPEDMFKFLRNSGHALGTVMSIGATAGVGGGLGLGSEAANMAAIGVGFFGDQLKEKKLMYDNPVKAYTSALLNTGLYMAMGKRIFPADKVKQAFGEVSPEVDNIVENLASGKITREAAKEEMQGLGKKMIDFAGGTLSKNAKITAELTAIDKLGKLADEVMGGNPKSENDIEKSGTTFLSNLAVAGLAKYGEMKTGNRVIENSLDKAASEPLQSGRAIDILTESQDVKDQMKSNLGFLADVKSKLVEDGVDPKQHGRFLFEALREKVATDNLEAPKKAPLGTSTRKLNEQINNAQDIQEKILNGEDVVANEEKYNVPKEESSVAIIRPEENKVADIIPLKKSNENIEEPAKPVPAEAQEPSTTTTIEDQQSAETGQGEPPKEPAANDLPFGKQETIGVAHEAQQVRAYDVNAKQPVRGEGVSTAESIEHGKKLISDGKDPGKIAEAFKADPNKNISYDAISVARAHYNSLAKETNAAADKFGETSNQYKEAKERERKWYDETYKPMQTEWSKIGESQQGLTDIDTGSYSGIIRAKEAATGKGATREQAKEARNLRKHIEKIEAEHEKLKEQFTTAINEYAASAKENKSYSAKAQSLANKIREKAKLHRPGSFSAATPASLVWDGAVEVVAKSVEAGGILADAIAAGLKHIQESAWYKGLTDDKKKEAEEDFEKWHEEEKELSPEEKNIQRLKDELERLKKEGTLKDKSDKRELTDEENKITAEIEKEKERIRYNNLAEDLAWKRDNKFTPDQSKEIWAYAKKMYIDNNPNFQVADMVNKVAMDLGLTPEQVRHALAPNPVMKKLTDQMYRNQYERNKAGRTVEQWVNKSKESVVDKMFNAVASPFRSLVTLGHGNALLFTHAAANIYDPALVKKFFELAGKQFKIVYGNSANYEKASERLKNDKLYNTALKAGVGVDPNTIYDDWQIANTWLKKLGAQGNKGFLVLKIMRMEVFKYHYNKLSDIEKADKETVKTVGAIANHWTGTAGLKVSPAANAFIFAPNLIVSKFARLTTDPAKALITYGKLGFGKEVSTADRVAARIILHKSGRVMAMYLASLVANQALLSITGSNQSINFTNPFKSDWLKYKAGNKTIDASGGMLSAMQFLSQLGALPFQGKKGLKENYYGAGSPKDALASTLSGQARKMASPFGSIAFDALTHTDYSGNVVPWSNDKPRAGREKLSILDYAMQKMPIPVADAYKEVGEQMKEDGVSTPTVKNILGGLLAVGITSSGIKEGNEPKERPSPFTKEDEKDPTFKFFLDKGLELPNTAPSSEKIRDQETHKEKLLSEYPKDVQDNYIVKHKEHLKDELDAVKKQGFVFVDAYGNVSKLPKSPTTIQDAEDFNLTKTKKIDDLNKVELEQVLRIAQSEATEKTKKELFYNKKK